jgi:RecA-family ATPase
LPLFTADNLALVAPSPEPSLVGNGLLTEQGIMLITGKTESCKSVLAIDMAISLAIGEPLFRAYRKKKDSTMGVPYFPVKRPYKVLYLDSELGPSGFHRRLQSFYGLRPKDFALGDNFKVVSGAKAPLMFYTPEQTGLNNIKELLHKVRPEVLVIDPLGDFHNVDENSAEMRLVFLRLYELQQEFNFSSIVLHHESDKEMFTESGQAIKRKGTQRSRGHSSIVQKVDSYLSIDRLTKEPYTYIELAWEKVRHDSHPPTGFVFADLTKMELTWMGPANHFHKEERMEHLALYKNTFPLADEDEQLPAPIEISKKRFFEGTGIESRI